MSTSDGKSKGGGGWLFTILVFAGGLLLFAIGQQRLPALAAIGLILAVIGGLGILTRLRDAGL